jgi:hypothetical protein
MVETECMERTEQPVRVDCLGASSLKGSTMETESFLPLLFMMKPFDEEMSEISGLDPVKSIWLVDMAVNFEKEMLYAFRIVHVQGLVLRRELQE